MDRNLIEQIASSHKIILTIEENSLEGGFGSGVMEIVSALNYSPKIFRMGIPDMFIEQGPRVHLLKNIGLTADGISATVDKLAETIHVTR